MAENVFNEMDMNQDKKVTKEEFIEVCLRNNTISGMLANKVLKVITTDTS